MLPVFLNYRVATEHQLAQRRTRARGLRIAGVVVLLAGLVAAVGVLVMSRGAVELPDATAAADYYKADKHQMDVLSGQAGIWTDNFRQELAKPEIQSLALVVGAALIAGICFGAARLMDFDAK